MDQAPHPRDPAKPKVVTGDASGVFDIPEKDATLLLKTKGWKRAAKRKPDPEPEPEAEEEEAEEEEGPDVDGLRSKEAARELREKWVGKDYDIEDFDDDMKLSDMKIALNKAIYNEGA